MGWNSKQLAFWTPLIDKKQFIDGFGSKYCNWCGAIPSTLKKHGLDSILMSDHIDNDPSHDVIENLQWVCRGCNKRKNPRKDILPSRILTQSEYTNKQEKFWREWLMQNVIITGGFPIKQAIYSGAEIFHVSPDTIDRRWLPKMVSDAGKLSDQEVNDVKEPILTLKSHEAKTETESKRDILEKQSQDEARETFIRGGHFFNDK